MRAAHLHKFDTEMAQDLFKYLPSEIIINILSRLPVRTVVTSKCVCKPWLGLLESDEFVKSHFAKSVPSLVVVNPDTELCTIFYLEEEIDVGESQDRRYNPLTKFVFPHSALMLIVGSANGFLCLRKRGVIDVVYICNPIAREYIELRHSRGFHPEEVTYGFGRSKITGKYKCSIFFTTLLLIEETCFQDRIVLPKLSVMFTLWEQDHGNLLKLAPCWTSVFVGLVAF